MKRKRILWFLLFTLILVVLAHTRLVECPFVYWAKQVLIKQGFTVEVGDFDWNLFSLSLHFKQIRVKSPCIEGSVEELTVNADYHLLLGQIALDEISLKKGELKVLPDKCPEDATQSPQAAIEVSLKKMQINDLHVQAYDSEIDLNLDCDDINAIYSDSNLQIEGGFSSGLLAPYVQNYSGSPDNPVWNWTLSALTNNFLDYENVLFQAKGPGSQCELSGELKKLKPDLIFHAQVDVIHPSISAPLQVDARIDEELRLNLCTELNLEEKQVPVFLSGQSESIQHLFPMEVGIDSPQIFEAEFFFLSADLDFLSSFSMNPAFFMPKDMRLPEYFSNLEGFGSLTGKLNLEDPLKSPLRGGIRLLSDWLQIELSLNNEDVMAGSGDFQAGMDHRGFFSFSLDHYLESGFLKAGLEGDDLSQWIPGQGIPPSLSYMASFDFDWKGNWSDAIVMSGFYLDLPPFEELPEVQLEGRALGRLDNLACDVLALSKGQSLFNASVRVNALSQSFDNLALSFQEIPVKKESFLVLLEGQLEGHGTIKAPELEGRIKFSVQEDEKLVMNGHVRGAFKQDRATFSEVSISLDQLTVNGLAHANFPEFQPVIDLVVRTETQADFEPMLDVKLPELVLQLNGDLESLVTDWWIPQQDFQPFEGADFKIFGKDGHLSAAGLRFDRILGVVEAGKIRLKGEASLENAERLSQSLKAYMPPDIELKTFQGEFVADFDLFSLCPSGRLKVNQCSFETLGENIELQPFMISVEDEITVSPITVELAGNVTKAEMDPWQFGNSKLHGQFKTTIQQSEGLNEFLHKQVSEDLFIQKMDLGGEFHFDLDTNSAELALDFRDFQTTFMGVEVTGDLVGIEIGQGIFARADGLKINGKPTEISQDPQGFHLKFELLGKDFPYVDPDCSGRFQILISSSSTAEFHQFDIHIKQKEGVLSMADPAVSLEELQFHSSINLDAQKGYSITVEQLEGRLNGGSFHSRGLVYPLDQVNVEMSCEKVRAELGQNHATLTSDLKLVSLDEKYELSGYVVVDEGDFFPEITFAEIAEFLVPPYPFLAFPDPFLEQFILDLEIENVTPLSVSHEFGYLELTIPSLTLLGSLAEPELYSGFVHIEPDSYFKLGKEVFLFKPSEVLFQPERPGEPYLQLFLEYGKVDSPKSMQITGYSSDLENSPGATSITSFFASFLLGKYTNSLLSLEYRDDKELSDSSFSAVFEKQLGSKVYSRYVVPLDMNKATQRAELGFGPFNDLFLSVSQTVEDVEYSARKTYHLGRGEKTHSQVNDVDWEFLSDLPFFEKWWIRRHWPLQVDSTYSPGRLRQSERRFLTLLKERGYLQCRIDPLWNVDKGRLHISVETGPKFEIEANGFELSTKDLELIRGHVLMPDQIQSSAFKDVLRKMTLEHGYLPGDPKIHLSENKFVIDFRPDVQLKGHKISLLKANAILHEPLKDSKWRKELIQDMLLEPQKAKDNLRGLLAAQGYLQPKIEDGRLNAALDLMTIPIDPGPKAKLAGFEFYENLDNQLSVSFELLDLVQKRLELPELFQSFDYSFLLKTQAKLDSQLKDQYFVNIKPQKKDQDVWFQITLRKKKEEVFHQIQFSGLNRLPEKSLYRLVRLSDSFSYPELIHAQNRLLEAGQFQAVQLITKKDTATFKLQERNRYDIGLGLTYSDQGSFSGSIQFLDRMFLKRPNDWSVRLLSGHEEDQALTRFVFRNFFKSPGDFILFGSWREENIPSVSESSDFGIRRLDSDYQVYQKVTGEYSWPISAANRLNMGTEYTWVDRFTSVEEFDEFTDELLESRSFKVRKSFFPINLSWSYRSFDRQNNPKNGMLATTTYSYYLPRLSESDSVGSRWTLGLTWFKSFKHWGSSHRLKSGIYSPKGEGFFDLGEENPTLFYLGGLTNMRGYSANTLGPYDFVKEKGKGGNAMIFLSEEWVFHSDFYGLGVASFLDAGQVWANTSSFDLGDLKYAAGVGLVYDAPFGLFRVDYTVPLNETNKEIEQNWTLTFGTVF